MRALLAAVLCLCFASCSVDDTPTSPGAIGSTPAGPGEDRIRFVHPVDGTSVHADEPFPVILEQEVRTGPTQGRGRLQASVDGDHWRTVAEFPWSREADQIRFTATLPAPNEFFLRVHIFEEGASEPWMEAGPIRIHARPAPPRPDDIAPGSRG